MLIIPHLYFDNTKSFKESTTKGRNLVNESRMVVEVQHENNM